MVEAKPLTKLALERQELSPRLGQVRTLAPGRSAVFNASVQVAKSLRYGRVAYDVALHVVPGVQVQVNPAVGLRVELQRTVLVAAVPAVVVKPPVVEVRLFASLLSAPFKPI